MNSASTTTQEQARIALLQATRLLEASDPPPAFSALVRLAATQLACPKAAIYLIDAHCVQLLAGVGQVPRRQSREQVHCTQARMNGNLPVPPGGDTLPAAHADHPLTSWTRSSVNGALHNWRSWLMLHAQSAP